MKCVAEIATASKHIQIRILIGLVCCSGSNPRGPTKFMSKKAKKKLFEKARNYGRIMAARMFEDFLDETNQGPNFSWAKFPNMVASLAEVNVFTNFAEDIDVAVECAAAISAHAEASRLVLENKLVEIDSIVTWDSNHKFSN